MRTEAELNEFLGRAAGFVNDAEGFYGAHWKVLVSKGNYCWLKESPDFCHDMNACLKWLGPMFQERVMVSSKGSVPAVTLVDKKGRLFSALEETLALAFARAAEQALEAKKGS